MTRQYFICFKETNLSMKGFKDYMEKKFGKKIMKRILVFVVIYLVISFVNVGVDEIFGFSWDKIVYTFQPKPEIVVNIQKYTNTELNHSQQYPGQLYLITACNEKIVLYQDFIISPLLGRADIKTPFSYSNTECTFDDGEKCTYCAIQIGNIGNAPAKSFTMDAFTSSSKIEFTNLVSPKIELSEHTGFFGVRGFRARVDEIDNNEDLGFLIKLDPDSDINSVCKVNENSDLCIQNLIEVRTRVLKEGELINICKCGKLELLDVSNIPDSYDAILYDYDSESHSFIKTDAIIHELECIPQ